MALETEVLKQLLATFQTELEENLQVITEGLFRLEKNNKKKSSQTKVIEEIFRAAHNIKGAARGLGVTYVADLAHHIESIFASIRAKTLGVSTDIINLCLAAVDGMQEAMRSFCDKTPLNFDLEALINKLQQGDPLQQDAAPLPLDNTLKTSQSDLKDYDTGNYESIRVSLHQINQVSALIEEMQTKKIVLEEHYLALTKLAAKLKELVPFSEGNADPLKEINHVIHGMLKNMHRSVNEFRMISNSLQEEARRLRLIPISTLLRPLTRYVRNLAQELNKEIEFEITGDGISVDKMILEGLKDPIIHLLRNAIDHGIESPALRKKKGKPAFGKINIEVIDENNQILLHIRDDGAGIDYKKIAALAKKKNVISSSELANMDEASILDLIYLPEFSTKEIITDISGRGVGLDVVKTNLANLKSTITLTTELGKGTTFHLQLPLTLASDIGLTIKSADQLFVIPTSAIEHIMLLSPNEIHEVETRQIILFNKKPIPLCILSDILGLEKKENTLPDPLPIVILKKGLNSIALLVEEITREHEIIIKPLQAPLTKISCVVGGTLSGTGEVIIVLNPADLINTALHSANIPSVAVHKSTAPPKHHILLVDDSITTRTLEKNILENNDYKVTIAIDGKIAWDFLQNQTFSLVITDIEMPNMDGFELTERIKKSEKLGDLPVIIVTSFDSDNQKKRGVEVGANAYIVKHDFESTKLLEIVAQLV